MKKSYKLLYKAGIFLFAITGIVGAYFFTRNLNEATHHAPDALLITEEQYVTEAEAAMTDEEMDEFLAGMKRDAQDAAEADLSENGIDSAEKASESIINFEELWEMNPHVYAWVTVPGTGIDYPVLQHPTDNAFYLNYKIDGSYGLPGSIYTENLNATDFTDSNTVIYGHNMKDGTMFATLHKLRERDFFEQHHKIIIYLPDEILEYDIFAAYIYDDRHLMHSFDFSNQDVYSAYLEAIFNIRDMGTIINRNISVTKQDKIITLSTCVNNQDDKRLLVHAVHK